MIRTTYTHIRIYTLAHWYIGILVYILFLTSCSFDKTKVSGTITHSENDTLFLEKLLPKNVEKADSAVTDSEGNFKFSFKTDETAFYRLRFANNQMIVLIINPKDDISITAVKDSLAASYMVEGSEDCNLIKELNQHQMKLEKIVSGYQNMRKNMMAYMQTDAGKAAKDSLFKVMMFEEKKIRDKYTEHKQYIKGFIDEHSTSLASLLASARLDQNEDFEYLWKVDSTLNAHYPNSPYLTDMHKKVEELKIFAIGATPPDILLNDPQGKPLSLSSLKGKLVLVNFWASLSKPSRVDNRTLTSLYKKYNEKGFEIFSVSFDLKKEDWTTAIKQDSLIWPYHVSDLKGMNSQVAKDYKLKNIPFNMLLSPEGKILSKGLKGLELRKRVRQELKVTGSPDDETEITSAK